MPVSISEESLCPLDLSFYSSASTTLLELLSLCVKFWNQTLSVMTFVKAIWSLLFLLLSYGIIKIRQQISKEEKQIMTCSFQQKLHSIFILFCGQQVNQPYKIIWSIHLHFHLFRSCLFNFIDLRLNISLQRYYMCY